MKEELPLKRRILYLLLPYLVFAGFLVSVEGAVRATNPYVSRLDLFTQENFNWKVKVNHGQQIFEGDALLGWKLKPNLKMVNWDFTTFSTNDQGLRYDSHVGRKREGAIRILALGDSVTFGYRVPVALAEDPLNFDPSQKPFTKIIEDSLRQLNPGREIHVIPMAVPGYTSFQGLKWLERDIEKFKPDLIIVLYGWNDTELHKTADKIALPDSLPKYIERDLISKSQALIYANKLVQKNKEKEKNTQVKTEFRVSKEDFISNILSIYELAREHQSKTMVLGTVLRDTQTNPQGLWISQYRTALAQAMEEKGVPYLQIPELTEANYPDNLKLFGELIHPNHIGHQIMADKIMRFIKEKNLLQDITI